MTIKEMHYDFNVKLDKVGNLSKDSFNRAEIDWLLNEAQEVFVKTRMGLNNPKREGFEMTQKRIDDLSSIVVKYPEQPAITPTLDSGVYEIELDTLTQPYMFLIRAVADVKDDNDCEKSVTLKFVQHDDLSDALEDPFSSPANNLNDIPYNIGRSSDGLGSSLYIYPGSNDVQRVRLEYIKRPKRIYFGDYTYIDGSTTVETSSELPDHTHSEIVDLAVKIAAEIIEHPNYVQLKNSKLLTNE